MRRMQVQGHVCHSCGKGWRGGQLHWAAQWRGVRKWRIREEVDASQIRRRRHGHRTSTQEKNHKDKKRTTHSMLSRGQRSRGAPFPEALQLRAWRSEVGKPPSQLAGTEPRAAPEGSGSPSGHWPAHRSTTGSLQWPLQCRGASWDAGRGCAQRRHAWLQDGPVALEVLCWLPAMSVGPQAQGESHRRGLCVDSGLLGLREAYRSPCLLQCSRAVPQQFACLACHTHEAQQCAGGSRWWSGGPRTIQTRSRRVNFTPVASDSSASVLPTPLSWSKCTGTKSRNANLALRPLASWPVTRPGPKRPAAGPPTGCESSSAKLVQATLASAHSAAHSSGMAAVPSRLRQLVRGAEIGSPILGLQEPAPPAARAG